MARIYNVTYFWRVFFHIEKIREEILVWTTFRNSSLSYQAKSKSTERN
jgi:hypothetical protein